MTDTVLLRAEIAEHIERERLASLQNPLPEVPLGPESRARAEVNFPARWGDVEPVAHVEDVTIDSEGHDLQLRIYRPDGAKGTILFFHGGGWVNGSVDTHDGSTSMLANKSGAAVISVNYRKAPEAPYPAGLNDCEAAFSWVIGQGTPANEIVISGESAGGNLAAVLAHRLRDQGVEIAGQMLIYPVTDGMRTSESYSLFAEGYILTRAGMEGCFGAYAPVDTDVTIPEISPIYASNFAGLAPTFITTCACDPLRDEGRVYAAKMVVSGVNVDFKEYAGATHGIWLMRTVTPVAEEIVSDNALWARRIFRGA